jgi:hypothetical protein
MLTVGVWDEDNVEDELAGSLHFNMKELLDQEGKYEEESDVAS